MDNLDKITERIINFRNERDWKQFHNSKDVALSLVLEANELLEHFQWKNGKELEEYTNSHKKEIGDELSDILYWVLLMSHDLDIDIVKALDSKMAENEAKYVLEKAKGNHKKYNQL